MRSELRERFGADTFPQIGIAQRSVTWRDTRVRPRLLGEEAPQLAGFVQRDQVVGAADVLSPMTISGMLRTGARSRVSETVRYGLK